MQNLKWLCHGLFATWCYLKDFAADVGVNIVKQIILKLNSAPHVASDYLY